jgi:hypothetical protein
MPHRHEAAASDMKDENRVLATHFHEKTVMTKGHPDPHDALASDMEG